jgi:hypothetical protein
MITLGATAAAPGNFDVGTGAASASIIGLSSLGTWATSSINGIGTVSLSRIDRAGAAGTFSFTAPPVAGTGATGARVVTNGAFNVTF